MFCSSTFLLAELQMRGLLKPPGELRHRAGALHPKDPAPQPRITPNPDPFLSDTLQPPAVVAHTKGCRCKRSKCLKNYCECHHARIRCSDICQCVGCLNVC